VKKRTAMILTVSGGAFYIIGGFVAYLVVAGLGGFTAGLTGSQELVKSTQEAMTAAIVTGLITGIIIIVCGILINSESSRNRKIGAIIAIIVAILGTFNTFGGLLIGLVLTIIGASVGLTYKPKQTSS